MVLMEVKMQGSYLGQQVISTFNYQGSGTPAAVSMSFALSSAFGLIPSAGVYPTGTPFYGMRNGYSNQVSYSIGAVRDIYSDTDFYETPLVPLGVGNNTGTPSPSFNAFGFRTNRVRADIRRGFKRLPGVVTEVIGSNGALTSTALTAAQANAGLLSLVLTYDDEGNTLTFTPCVLGREKYAVPDSSPIRYAYRYYPTEAEQEDFVAAGIVYQANTTVRSQVSRQIGRGA